jgi:MFS transporter, MHS family, proline/betaine transporter
LLGYINTPFHLFLIQSFFILFILSTNPATPVFYTHIPVFKRFTFISLTYAISRALMHVTTSFGLVYLISFLGNAGLLVIMLPVSIGYALGVLHFEKLEKEAENHLRDLYEVDNAYRKFA